MKRPEWLLLFMLILMALFTTENYAQSPREQLQQMVERLQKNSADFALREKIIKLAQELKPAPAVPEEAERFEGRAQFAFKSAKSPVDYLDAAREYEKAIAAAPWVPGYYSDLCTIYEKAEKYAEAKKNCEFFLVSSPSAQDASDVRKRIAGLEFAIEKMSKQKNQGEEFLKKLDGARFVKHEHWDYHGGGSVNYMQIYEIRGNRAFRATMTISCKGLDWCKDIGVVRWLDNTRSDKDGYLITGHEFIIPKDDQLCRELQSRCVDQMQNINDDGNKITERLISRGVVEGKIFLREK